MTEGLPFRILVVEDDEDDRMIIDEAFLAIGFAAEVKKFINGKTLLHYLEQVGSKLLPSLIVLDNSLPELNAIDLLKILKTSPSYQDIPVVVYTTMLTEAKERQLLSLGAHTCFQKGNTLQEVVELAEALKRMAQGNLQAP
jgi:CheY-like chemotaxis protein